MKRIFLTALLAFTSLQGDSTEIDPIDQSYLDEKPAYEKSCQDNDGDGCSMLGIMYRYGKGAKVDYGKAADFFSKSCRLRDHYGCNELGDMYDTGKGVKQNYQTAEELYKLGCRKGITNEECPKYFKYKNIKVSDELYTLSFTEMRNELLKKEITPEYMTFACHDENGWKNKAYSNCKEYYKLLNDKHCLADTNVQMAFSDKYTLKCSEIELFKNASAPKISYFNLDLSTWWKELPTSIIKETGGIYSEDTWNYVVGLVKNAQKYKSLGDIPNIKVSCTKKCSKFKFIWNDDTVLLSSIGTFDGDPIVHRYIETFYIVLADFDHDGVAELFMKLVSSSNEDRGSLGNLSSAYTVILKKDSKTSPIYLFKQP